MHMIQPDAKITPMLQQYLEIKEQHPECLLLFRLGDFYELFFQDAIKAAPALDIVLTRRGKKDDQDIPMCGIPFHAADSYIARLIQKGFKVALCEQLETPEDAKKRGAKSVVRRDVVRILTPGTLTEETLLESRQNNFLLSIVKKGEIFGIASVDISTGYFALECASINILDAVLMRLMPKEILISQTLADVFVKELSPWKQLLSPQPDSRFDAQNAHKKLIETFHVSTMEGFGNFSEAEIIAGGSILDYIALTQKGKIPALTPPRQILSQEHLHIDASTRQSLELHQTLRGEYKGSLLQTIDRTLTAAGGRLLSQRLSNPLTNLQAIQERLSSITWLMKNPPILDALRSVLKNTPDLERVLARLALGRGGPRDLGNVRDSLKSWEKIKDTLSLLIQSTEQEFAKIFANTPPYQAIIQTLENALGETLPILTRDGNFIATGFHPPLDELRHLRDEGKKCVVALQSKYCEETHTPSLKIKHNHVLGYYIEITLSHANKMPAYFIHRQTLANNVRYTTVELGELESKLSTAADQALALELGLFQTLLENVLQHAKTLSQTARSLAILDVSASLAILAQEQGYCIPTVDNSRSFLIEKGFHPTVAQSLKTQLMVFTPNDCVLNDKNTFWLITGPNMAGKSTFLRQNALIIILAQMGSYVPAKKAHIGVVDKIFSRVGAADDLARGQSTFMVEMVETAVILNQASPQSFVILDEIGRGTSTYDGLSIAWATAEHLHTTNKSRTLFSTHYHELGSLKQTLSLLSCHTMKVREWQDKIIFLHEVVPGLADRSYGIHVAELAGVPSTVLNRAKTILSFLEEKKARITLVKEEEDLPLLNGPHVQKKSSAVEVTLKNTDIDALTPRQAMDLIYKLKEQLGD
jgi:DNA mismatch repair protein MutS